MIQSSLFPLRTIVGDAVPLGKTPRLTKTFESRESRELGIEYEFSVKPSIDSTVTDPRYIRYLPTFDVAGRTLTPGRGMDTLPIPPRPLPFDADAQVLSFFALGPDAAAADVSRKLAVKFTMLLPDKFLIGGICFGGFPYLPSFRDKRLHTHGENASNYGLPREVRVTCFGQTGDAMDSAAALEFLDADIAATKQDTVSHSGFHYLCVEPTLTNLLTVHFSDYPRIVKAVSISQDSGQLSRVSVGKVDCYGFIIPYFYVFEYRESTRYRPRVAGGLLGTDTSSEGPPLALPLTPDTAFANALEDKFIVDSNSDRTGEYFDFTAASIFFPRQRDYVTSDRRTLKECFVSSNVLPGKSIVLFVQQGEEFERCVAGLKLFLPFVPNEFSGDNALRILNLVVAAFPGFSFDASAPREELEHLLRAVLRLPQDVDFCEKIGIRVFELDPLEGVSPIAVPLESKHATLLAASEIDELSELALAVTLEGIRFGRSSNARYFAVELTNRDSKPGQFAVKALTFVQSAHVSVHPRAARTQQIKTLNFRIIGAGLADDYSVLGKEGFNFTIERLVAGERKGVLFRANSLLDLLQTGAARLTANSRTWEITEEHAEMHARSRGWRRNEVGDGVRWLRPRWRPAGVQDRPPTPAFESTGNQETRTHTELVGYEGEGAGDVQDQVRKLNDALIAAHRVNSNIEAREFAPLPPSGTHRLIDGDFADLWAGIDTSALESIRGLYNLNVPPHSFMWEYAQNVLSIVRGAGVDPDIVSQLAEDLTTGLFISGLSTSFGMSIAVEGIGPSLSVSYGQQVPLASRIVQTGETGSIQRQAFKAGSQSNQTLGSSFERTRSARRLLNRTRERLTGCEVGWQGQLVDIITGSIPLNFTLTATSSKLHVGTADDSLCVRFGSGVGKSVFVDFWFDLTEEMVKDEY